MKSYLALTGREILVCPECLNFTEVCKDFAVHGVNFKADKELVCKIGLFATLESDGMKKVRKISATVEERRKIALAFIDENHSMSIAEYMRQGKPYSVCQKND